MAVVTPLTAVEAGEQEAQVARESYFMRVLVAADIAANVALGGREDETISTRAALMARKHEFLGVVVSRMLNLFEGDHGAKAVAGDTERAGAEAAALGASGLVRAE